MAHLFLWERTASTLKDRQNRKLLIRAVVYNLQIATEEW